MNPNQIRALVTFGLCVIGATVFGYLLAVGNYNLLLLVVYAALAVFVLVSPAFAPLVALAILCPFSLPIPYIYGFPFTGLILGLCILKYMIRSWIVHREARSAEINLPLGFALFFGWVLMRYCIDPVLPNTAGFGANVTGFRAYLNYGISFGLVVSLGLFIRTREDLRSLMLWLGRISLLFALLFIPLVFTKSQAIVDVLWRLGISAGMFDNGWLRFVVLPGFGCILIGLAMLPNLVSWSRLRRNVMICLGVLAIMFGGNRASLLSAFALVLSVALVRRRLVSFSAATITLVICLATFRYVGEHFEFEQGFGFFRILSLASQRVARESGTEHSLIWRQLRWERAMQDVYRRPWIGMGYGGLENAFVFGNVEQAAAATVEIDVAAGTIHNGFIAGARALGIPGLVLFLTVFIGQIAFNAIRTARHSGSLDAVYGDLHCFVFANLASLPISILIGYDLNWPYAWFFLALGGVADRIRQVEWTEPESSESSQPESSIVPERASA